MLNVLEGYPLRDYGYGSAQRRALSDRSDAPRVRRSQQLLGDPAFVKNPIERLLDKGYAEQHPRRSIDPQARRRFGASSSPASPLHEGTHTTHYSIVDDAATRSR